MICTKKICHPNISLFEGIVWLSILAEWFPDVNCNDIIREIIQLFIQPDLNNIMNSEAKDLYETSPKEVIPISICLQILIYFALIIVGKEN